MTKLYEILKNLRPDVSFETETSLMDGDILDSFDMIALVGELEQGFGVSVGLEELVPVNFNSAEAIGELLKRLGAKL